MSGHAFDNSYDLSNEQLQQLEEAEEAMLRADFGKAEKILLAMLEEDDEFEEFTAESKSSYFIKGNFYPLQ